MAQKMAFFAPGLYRLQKTRLSFFECFPYVCPETVSINRSGFYKCKNGIAQRRVQMSAQNGATTQFSAPDIIAVVNSAIVAVHSASCSKDRAGVPPAERKRRLSQLISIRLSRACLGKMIHVCPEPRRLGKTGSKTTGRFFAPDGRTLSTSSQLSSSLRKTHHLFLSAAFPIFVPSLSW